MWFHDAVKGAKLLADIQGCFDVISGNLSRLIASEGIRRDTAEIGPTACPLLNVYSSLLFLSINLLSPKGFIARKESLLPSVQHWEWFSLPPPQWIPRNSLPCCSVVFPMRGGGFPCLLFSPLIYFARIFLHSFSHRFCILSLSLSRFLQFPAK